MSRRRRFGALIVISGPPASGKTTLAARLADELRLPWLGRDALKETLFDTLGWDDRARSRALGAASWALLYQLIDALLAGGAAFIVESNFRADADGARLRELQARHAARAVELLCTAHDAELLRRYTRRANDGSRHPGHVDHANRDEFLATLRERHDYSLGLDGPRLTLDTTDPAALDVPALATTLRKALRDA